MFGRVSDLLRWFKEHFRDPVPGQSTPSTPRGAMTSRTPYTTTPGTVSGKTIYIVRIIVSHQNSYTRVTPGIYKSKNIFY